VRHAAASRAIGDEISCQDGKTYAVITDDRPMSARQAPVAFGTEIEIPNNKLKWTSPIHGHGIVFLSRSRYVFCYVTAGLIARYPVGHASRRSARLAAPLVDGNVAMSIRLLIHPLSPAAPCP